jgi:two-component system chemotaxis sensor kinase CheA
VNPVLDFLDAAERTLGSLGPDLDGFVGGDTALGPRIEGAFSELCRAGQDLGFDRLAGICGAAQQLTRELIEGRPHREDESAALFHALEACHELVDAIGAGSEESGAIIAVAERALGLSPGCGTSDPATFDPVQLAPDASCVVEIRGFIGELGEHLQQMGDAVLDEEGIAETYRGFFAAQSTAGLLGFWTLERLNSAASELLGPNRVGESELSPNIRELLLAVVDRSLVLLDAIARAGHERGVDIDDLVLALAREQEGTASLAQGLPGGTHRVERDELDLEILREFVAESQEFVDQVEQALQRMEGGADVGDTVATAFRAFHSMKGAASFLDLPLVECLTHQVEGLLVPIRSGERPFGPAVVELVRRALDQTRELLSAIGATGWDDGVSIAPLVRELIAVQNAELAPGIPGWSGPLEDPSDSAHSGWDGDGTSTESPRPPSTPVATVRIPIPQLDRLTCLVSELVQTRNLLIESLGGRGDPRVVDTAVALGQIADALQNAVRETHLQPVGSIWRGLPRTVRDLGRACGRELDLTLIGEEIPVRRSVLEAIKDPLLHLVRNAVDHGLEPPEDRETAGKPRRGTLTVRAIRQGGDLVLEIQDDGRGIDAARLREKAAAQGLMSPGLAAALTDREAVALVFHPGLSLAAAVTRVSGRGVGMDVVRTNTERIGGSVQIETCLGIGTTVVVRIPAGAPAPTAIDEPRRATEPADFLDLSA